MEEYWGYPQDDDIDGAGLGTPSGTVGDLLDGLHAQIAELSDALSHAIAAETEQHKAVETLTRQVQYLEEKLAREKVGVREALLDEIACEFEREREPYNKMKLLREENAKLRAELKNRNRLHPYVVEPEPYNIRGFNSFPGAMSVSVMPVDRALPAQEHFRASKDYDMHRAEEIYTVMMSRPENAPGEKGGRLAVRYSSVPLSALDWTARQQAAREIVNSIAPMLYTMIMGGRR